MSLRITKAGLLDTIQDEGRHGYEHLGINPGGSMDRYSAALANALLGVDLDAPVLELHFPAAHILFERPTVIALTGGDFTPTIDGRPAAMNHPIAVAAGARLRFEGLRSGTRAYLSVIDGLQLEPWLGSYSTNLRAGAGGWEGRALRTHDVIPYRSSAHQPRIDGFEVLHWKAHHVVDERAEMEFLIGSEWHRLTPASRRDLENGNFLITAAADRMGYRLSGPALYTTDTKELLSSGVTFGTVQLLPNGQVILLMADHQTTGGYPRIAQVITAHLPLLAQKKWNDTIRFRHTQLESAQEKLIAQKKYLQQLQIACKLKIDEWRNR